MSVVVLSKDYASSTWCLDELVMIMDRKRTAGHIVLPVFYDVDPSQVGEQTGNYAEAFAKHQDHFQDDMERVEKWKATLKEVAYLGGMVLQDRHESQFIGDIVEEVGKRLDSTVLLAPFIAWHRYRLLVKKTKMIVYILYIICISIFFGLFLYKFICTWIYLQSEVDRHLKDDHDRVWKGNGLRGAGTQQEIVMELLHSTGTKKNIDMGIKIMCSLVLAFCLS
ncbi:disease resistance protein RUN1-like [Populus alba x Populus x berolinensis]|nr:disease resistance protein RUN1-like [Populus alba x Populus x berolinensis]